MEVTNTDNTPALEINSRSLVETGQTVAVAESVTSGDVQSAFSSPENSLQFFEGSITVYNINQKVRHLHIDLVHA